MDAQADMAREDGATARNGYRERGLATPWRHRAAHPPAARGDTFPEGPDREVPAHGPRRRGGRRGVVGRRRLDEEDGADRPGVGIERLSKDRASTMRRSMDAGAAQLVSRDLGEVGFPYIILATHVKCRRDGRVQSTAVAAAIGDGSDGVRRLPGVAAVDAETHAGWLGFLRECGLSVRRAARRRRRPRRPRPRDRRAPAGRRLAALRRPPRARRVLPAGLETPQGDC